MGKVGKVVAMAVVAGVTGGLGAAAFAFSWSAFAGSMVLGGISYALTPKPKKPNLSSNLGSSTVAVRQSDLVRQHVYGHTRVTRGYANMRSTGLNGKLHMILMLCEGPLRSINEIWVNDYAIPPDWIDANGNVTSGRYAGKMQIIKHLGTDTQSADPLAMANIPGWDANCKLSGIAYLYIILTKDQDVYPSGIPNFSAIVEGKTLYDPRENSEVWTTNTSIHSCDFLRNERYGFATSDEDINFVNVAAQANICDEIVDTIAQNSTITAINTTTDLISLGNDDILPYQFGDRVKILTTGTAPGGLNTTDSYYVIPYQVKTDARIRLATSLKNAMDKVYINITSAGTGVNTISKTGEPRYHGGGVFDTDAAPSETLNNLVNSMAGRAVNMGGYWTLLAGAWRTPEVSFDIGDLRSAYAVKNSLTMAQSYNVVKGLFVSSLNAYQTSDYPSARYQTFINQDNGVESSKEINLPFTNRPTTAQRIAKIELFRGRQDIVYSSDFSTKGLQVQPGDNVGMDIDRLGWEGKEFEITEFTMDVADGSMVTRMSLRETAQEIFDWSSGEAIDYDPAPNTSLPDPFNVQVPTGVAYSSRQIDTREGDVVYTLVLNWEQHPDAFVVQFGDFEVQYKLSAETEWRPSFFVDGLLTSTDVLNSSVNIEYDIRIRARNYLGVRSEWNTILGAVVGSSGGVTTTYDYRFVNETVTIFNDWGNVYDTPTTFDDWGYVV